MSGLNLWSHHEAGVRGAARAAAVPGQHVLTRPLEVEGPAVEGVVVGVAEHRAHPRLCEGTEGEDFETETKGPKETEPSSNN